MESERKSPLFLFHAWRLSLALWLVKKKVPRPKNEDLFALGPNKFNTQKISTWIQLYAYHILVFMMAIVCSLCWFLNRELRNICFVGFFRENSQKKTICIWSDSAPSYFFRSDNAQQWGNRTAGKLYEQRSEHLTPNHIWRPKKFSLEWLVMVHLPATLLTP